MKTANEHTHEVLLKMGFNVQGPHKNRMAEKLEKQFQEAIDQPKEQPDRVKLNEQGQLLLNTAGEQSTLTEYWQFVDVLIKKDAEIFRDVCREDERRRLIGKLMEINPEISPSLLTKLRED